MIWLCPLSLPNKDACHKKALAESEEWDGVAVLPGLLITNPALCTLCDDSSAETKLWAGS
jgi:hypothetical protein